MKATLQDRWAAALSLDARVPMDGYRWWYLDAVSDDGTQGLTIIFFVGSVFSPYYAAQRRRRPTAPEEHVAVNVGLYTPKGRLWTMTERSSAALRRSPLDLQIGPSRLAVTPAGLELQFEEITAPLPKRVKGQLRLTADHPTTDSFDLGTGGRHHWQPIAACARIEVDFSEPAVRWRGHAYVDGNRGEEPIETGFNRWQWSRTTTPDGRCNVWYDYEHRSGQRGEFAVTLHPQGLIERCEPAPQHTALNRSLWAIPRSTAAPLGAEAIVARTLEDGPFYARSWVRTRTSDTTTLAVHESLSLDRFRRRWVQCLLPVRMPRRG